MANLLDTIRQNSTQAGTQQAGVTDETSRLQQLLRAKSGKAVTGPGVAASSLGEQQAVAATNSQIQNQIAPAAALQNTQIATEAAGQKQAETIQTREISQSRRFNTIQSNIQTERMLADLERGKGQIDLNRDKAAADQLVRNLRFQNQQYVDNLEREGARKRLDDEVSFKEEITKSAFNNNQELLEKQLGNKSILTASDREFKVAMGNMDITTAYDVFKNAQKAEKERALYGTVGALVTAGAGAYGTQQSGGFDSGYQDATASGGFKGSYSDYQDMQSRQDATQGPVRR